jgi:Fur family transcriptional regulator, peroxide stress response regulator
MKITKAQRFSKQRALILEIIKNTDSHPNADWIYNQAKDDMPNISLGTIYRNLSQLEESNQITSLHDQTQLRYDANLAPHDHFYCRNCGHIIDLLALNQETRELISQHVHLDFDSYSLELKGLCENCKDNDTDF